MQEASWVRSVYLYAMCAVSVVLIAVGAIASVSGVVRAVAPDLGHRDTLDRVGIGLSNIATNVVDLINEAEGGGAEGYCRDVTDNDDDFDACVEDQSIESDFVGPIKDGIDEVKSELRSQIRNSAIDQMIRGLLILAAGLLIYRIHGPRTDLFADGLMPNRPTSDRRAAKADAPAGQYQAPPVYQGGQPPYVSPQDPPLAPEPQRPIPPPPGAPPGG